MKRQFLHVFLPLVAFTFTWPMHAAAEQGNHELIEQIRELDRKLFDAGFNNCDIDTMYGVVAENLEFYHDQSGVMQGRDAYVTSIRDGICKLDYKARRELDENSMTVHALRDGGEIYGVIQQGEHRFYATYEGKPEQLTSTARFSILWLLRQGEWRMSRVFSYDHAPN